MWPSQHPVYFNKLFQWCSPVRSGLYALTQFHNHILIYFLMMLFSYLTTCMLNIAHLSVFMHCGKRWKTHYNISRLIRLEVKGTVHTKIKRLSTFADPCVSSKPFWNFEECVLQWQWRMTKKYLIMDTKSLIKLSILLVRLYSKNCLLFFAESVWVILEFNSLIQWFDLSG